MLIIFLQIKYYLIAVLREKVERIYEIASRFK